jgi:hypothetical protein
LHHTNPYRRTARGEFSCQRCTFSMRRSGRRPHDPPSVKNMGRSLRAVGRFSFNRLRCGHHGTKPPIDRLTRLGTSTQIKIALKLLPVSSAFRGLGGLCLHPFQKLSAGIPSQTFVTSKGLAPVFAATRAREGEPCLRMSWNICCTREKGVPDTSGSPPTFRPAGQIISAHKLLAGQE